MSRLFGWLRHWRARRVAPFQEQIPMTDFDRIRRDRAARHAVMRLAVGFSILAVLSIWALAGTGLMLWGMVR